MQITWNDNFDLHKSQVILHVAYVFHVCTYIFLLCLFRRQPGETEAANKLFDLFLFSSIQFCFPRGWFGIYVT